MTYKSELDIQIIYIEMDKMTLIDDKEEGITIATYMQQKKEKL